MIGQTISHYKIVDKIGEGEMSVVYKAEDTRLKRSVALKFLSQATLDDDEHAQRFFQEARAAAALDHPNICTVHEIDEADGKAFIVMAYIEGQSLKQRLVSGPLPMRGALDTAQQIAQGLRAAHGKGVVHRDIKPANVIVGDDGLARIVDFDPEPLTALRTGVPIASERIVWKCLQKTPADRYQHVDDVLVDLRSVAEQSETGASRGRALPSQPLAPSVAVLPFLNMNRDEENEFFSDGLTEELINALTQIEGLRVVSRTSVFHFKGKTEDIRQVGQKLRVRTVIEGSVRRAGNRIRVTAQLINVADGYHIWSQRYDREMKDVFDIQDEITAAIVDNLKVKLVGEDEGQPVKRTTADQVAYSYYLKGRFYLNQRESAALEKCIDCFEHAAREDESYALPHAGLAEAYSLQALGGYGGTDPDEALSKAKAAALRAIDLDDSCAEAHTALAVLLFRVDWDWTRPSRSSARDRHQQPVRYGPPSVRHVAGSVGSL